MRRFVAAFFRHPFTLILPAIIIPLIVVFAVRSFGSSYQSEATVYVTKDPLATSNCGSAYATPAQNLQTCMAQFVTSDPSFDVEVANQTDMPKTYARGTPGVNDLMVARIIAGMKITPSGNNFVLIQYSDTSPQIAAQVVQALLQVYITETIRLSQENAAGDISILNQLITQDISDLNQADQNRKQYVQSHPNIDPNTDAQYAQYQLAYQDALAKLQSDQQKLQTLTSRGTVSGDLTPYTVADPPLVPTSPTVKSKTTITAMIGGVALGLGVSLGLIGLLALADRRVYSRDDLIEAMPIPVLEVVPRLRGLENDSLIVGSEENLMQLAQVPVLATLPRFAESTQAPEGNRPFTNKAEDE